MAQVKQLGSSNARILSASLALLSFSGGCSPIFGSRASRGADESTQLSRNELRALNLIIEAHVDEQNLNFSSAERRLNEAVSLDATVAVDPLISFCIRRKNDQGCCRITHKFINAEIDNGFKSRWLSNPYGIVEIHEAALRIKDFELANTLVEMSSQLYIELVPEFLIDDFMEIEQKRAMMYLRYAYAQSLTRGNSKEIFYAKKGLAYAPHDPQALYFFILVALSHNEPELAKTAFATFAGVAGPSPKWADELTSLKLRLEKRGWLPRGQQP